MLTPLNRIIILVGDVQKCGRFYIESFGLKHLRDTPRLTKTGLNLTLQQHQEISQQINLILSETTKICQVCR
jgi:hypothetical protein